MEWFLTLWTLVSQWVLEFLESFTYLLSGDYYTELFAKYFSVTGFIVGLILVVILYSANPRSSSHPIVGFLQVVALVAVINCCYKLCIALYDLAGLEYFYGTGLIAMVFAADNMISGLILTMTITNDMRGKTRCAIMLSLACFVTMPMLRYELLPYVNEYTASAYEGEMLTFYLMALIVVGMLLGWIMCKRKYFYTAWIWYFCAHMVLRVAWFFVIGAEDGTQGLFARLLPQLPEYLGSLWVDYAIFVLALLVGLFFERGIAKKKPKRRTA